MGHAQQRRVSTQPLAVTRPSLSLLALLLTSPAFAQWPEPKLTVVSPSGAQAGTSVSILATGTDLEDADLQFFHPGFVAIRDAKDPKKWSVEISKNVPPGCYDARFAGKNGVSNPRRFEVGSLPETEALPKAVTKQEAQEITLPSVVRGSVPKQGMLWFKMTAVRGQELVFDCHANSLDSRLEPALSLFDTQGRELAGVRNKPLRWTPETDATLWLSLRDFINNGGNEHFFRLYAGSPGELKKAEAPALPLFWPPPAPSFVEQEPNDGAKAQPIVPPVEIAGEFYPTRDVDAFKFEAKKGDVWWMEVYSERFGVPTHPRLVVERLSSDKEGKQTAQDAILLEDAPPFAGDADFNGQHFDPSGRFEAKEEGTYRVQVRDINNAIEPSHARRYQLSIRNPGPDFALVAAVLTPTPNKTFKDFTGAAIQVRAANIRPAQVFPLRVLALRRDGFEGAISLEAFDLPPGLTAEPSIIGLKQTEGTLLLRAAVGAAPWSGSIRITGTSLVGGAQRKHAARASTPVWESTVTEFIEPPRSRFMDAMVCAIVDDAPFGDTLLAEREAADVGATEKVKFRLKVDHKSGEAAPVKVKVMGLAGLEKAKETEIAIKDASAEYEVDLAPLKLLPGDYTVWFRGEQKVKREVKGKASEMNVVLCSNSLSLKIKETQKP